MMLKINKTLVLALASLLLCSCAGVVLLGAAATGMVVYDKRSWKEIDKDYTINNDIRQALQQESRLSSSHWVVDSFNQIVFLGGQTSTAANRMLAESVARKVSGVKRVYNEMTIGANSSMKQRAKDSWLLSEIKTRMLARRGLKSGSIKVIVENGVVYLMGAVSHDQANLAVDIARRVEGVKRVVKIFQYTD